MKYFLVTLFMLSIQSIDLQAQKYDYYYEAFVGFPSGARTYTMGLANSSPGDFNGTIEVIPDMGFFIEAYLNPAFSVGFEFSYTNAHVSNKYSYLPPGFAEETQFKEHHNYTIMRFVPMWGIYFIDDHKFNLFISGGVGVALKEMHQNYRSFVSRGNDSFFFKQARYSNAPLTYRLALNVRYFPWEKVGFSASGGISETPFRIGIGIRY